MAHLRGSFGLGATIALSASLLAAIPALAQTSAPSTMKLGDNAPNGDLTKTHSDWRSSSLVGATVYNDQGNSIGTVSDLLVSSDGSVQNVILSVGGFLGIDSKLVEVPFNTIKFAPSASNPESGSKEATQANVPALAVSKTAPADSASNASTNSLAAAANKTGTAPVPTPATGLDITANTSQGAGMQSVTHEYSLVLPNATKASLTSDPVFSY